MSSSASVVRKYMHVRSVRDLDYELNANNCYHPAFQTASLNRLQLLYPIMSDLLKQLLASESSVKVWAIVIEYQHNPVLILRNLLHTHTTLAFRRVLHIKLEDISSDLKIKITNTCFQDNTNLMNEEEFPLTLVNCVR